MGLEDAAALARVVSAAVRWALALVALGVAWVWLQAPQLALLPGDEPLYLLDAQRLLDGGALYHDVFLAHPPARVWQAALVLATGAPIAWAKVWSPLATLASAALLFRLIAKDGKPGLGILAAFLFLLSNVVLVHGALFVGVEQASAIATLATVLALSGHWLLAGLTLSLASQWALHVALLALPLAVWAWRAGAMRRLMLGLALGLLPLLLELLWFGEPMIDQVFAYHLRKVTHMAAQKVPDRVWPFVTWQAPLLVLAAIGAWRGSQLARALGLSGFAVLALVLLWPRLQAYYFLLPMPWLAAAAALAFDVANLQRQPFHLRIVALLIVLGLVRPGVESALARRTSAIAAKTEMIQLAAQVQTLAGGKPLWGDGALVPLLSLRTGLPVALGDTDVNAQRFQSGVTPPVAHLAAVLAQKPLIVLVPRHGIDLVPEIHDQILRDCDVVGQFNAPSANFAGLLLRPR